MYKVDIEKININNFENMNINFLAYLYNDNNEYSYFQMNNIVYKYDNEKNNITIISNNINNEIIAEVLSGKQIIKSICHFDHMLKLFLHMIECEHLHEKNNIRALYTIMEKTKIFFKNQKETFFLIGKNKLECSLIECDIYTNNKDLIIKTKFRSKNFVEFGGEYTINFN